MTKMNVDLATIRAVERGEIDLRYASPQLMNYLQNLIMQMKILIMTM